MSVLFFYDDARARQFEPFALTRPGSELRAGTSLIRHRWERATSLRSAGFISGDHLAHFEEADAPPALAPNDDPLAASSSASRRSGRLSITLSGKDFRALFRTARNRTQSS